MADICPCCRRPLEVTSNLKVSLDWQIASRNGLMVDMSPQTAVVLHTLNRCWPMPAPYERLMSAMYGAVDPRSDDPVAVIKVRVSNLRRTIAPLKAKIHNVYGIGYRLELL